MKKNEIGRLTLPDFTSRVNIRWDDDRQGDKLGDRQTDRYINEKEETPKVNLHTFGYLIFNKGAKSIQWRTDNLSTNDGGKTAICQNINLNLSHTLDKINSKGHRPKFKT